LDNYKTIKELADELHVSKTAIHKKIDLYKNENIKEKHFSKIGNKFVIDEEGQKIITSMFNLQYDKERQPLVFENDNRKVSEVSELVSILKDRLVVADKQNEVQAKQINDLKVLLDQQQQLTLQSNKQVEKLQQQLLIATEEKEVQESQQRSQEGVVEAREEPPLNKQEEFEKTEKKKWFQFWK